jgi:hypothetical protein
VPYPEDNRIILQGNTTYTGISYKTEQELEKFALKNKDALFGKDSVYFDMKKVITSNANISRIPDGLLLTTDTSKNSKLWLVEYELSNHDLERHIYPQMLGFINALKNEATKRSIKELMYNTIKQNPLSGRKIKSILDEDEEIYHFLEIILDRNIGIVIVIDTNTPELEEITDSISTNMNIQTYILEFMTYRNQLGNEIHLLDTLPHLSPPKVSKEIGAKTWETRMVRASPAINELVTKLISETKEKFRCVGSTWNRWYAFYTNEPTHRKTLFGVIILGKNVASLCFRVNPTQFQGKENNLRKVKGYFFPAGTERRIHIEESSVTRLMQYLMHSYEVTQSLYKV